MAKHTINNIKLGVFVLGGLLFLIVLLYMIGKNRNMFGNNYVLKTRFENVQGLVPGNNVRFAGIQAGTVKRIKILNDTVIEVTMIIDTKMKDVIRKNALASIGTDGLVGNKVVNIIPVKQPAALAEENDLLPSKKSIDTEDMLQKLARTNNDIGIIASELKTTIQRFNQSNALWTLLNDESIPQNFRASVAKIRTTTEKANNVAVTLDGIIADIKKGKGNVGMILQDSSLALNLNTAILKINKVGDEADSLATAINNMVADIRYDVNDGKGTVNALLNDSLMLTKLNRSLDNIQKGTDGFNQNMEALKHNILFRGYFKKLEKKKKAANEAATVLKK
jgi:phospholipid/cholesterol/gamma-HCH transport system substrate-binding protein